MELVLAIVLLFPLASAFICINYSSNRLLIPSLTSSIRFRGLHSHVSNSFYRHQRLNFPRAAFAGSPKTLHSNPVDKLTMATHSHTKQLVLGSSSETRKQILRSEGFTFEIVKADIDERALGDRSSAEYAKDLVLLLGNAKADRILQIIPENFRDRVLVTSDQVVTCNGKILEKPDNHDEARMYIKDYGKHSCSTVGSIVLTDIETNRRVSGIDVATVHFDTIPDDIIEKLIEEGEVMYCAGALMVEHPLLQPYLRGIDGTEDSVRGLSIKLFLELWASLFPGQDV